MVNNRYESMAGRVQSSPSGQIKRDRNERM